MAVQNTLTPRTQMPDKAVEFQVNGANVRLSPSVVRNYLTNGDGRVSDQEVAMFINLCKYQKLNPLIKDAYLIKYGSQPATIVTSKDAIMKRAMRNPNYAGHQAGVIVVNQNSGELDYRTGAFTMPGEVLIGGWAKTYVKGYDVPIETAVSFEEYAGRKKDGSLNAMWAGKPGVMIRKVALVASLREAFPEDLQGMYASEEMNTAIDDTMAVTPPAELSDQQPQEQPDPVPVQIPQTQPDSITEPLRPQGMDWPEEFTQSTSTPQQTTMDDLQGVF